MSIQTRGKRGQTYVVGRSLASLSEMISYLLEHRNAEKTAARFNLTIDEVYHGIDFWTDINQVGAESYLTLSNEGDVENIQLDTTSVTSDVWLGIVNYARMFYPTEANINDLYQQGIRLVTLECYIDLQRGKNEYLSSDLHNLVFAAVVNAIGTKFDPKEMLRMLGIDEYLDISNQIDKNEDYTS
jgi:hypothetical protein